MLGRSFVPFVRADNFYGVNAKDTSENMYEGEWDKSSLNIFSDPQGAVGSRPGYTSLTTASIGTAVAWVGFYQFDKHSGGTTTSYFVGHGSNGKLYNYASNAYTELFSGLPQGVDTRGAYFTLDNTVVAIKAGALPVVWAGSGSATTFATSVTADWGLEWQRYPWLHSTVDPRLLYYGPLGDPDGAYTTFINFDEDSGALTGACKQGDDMLVGKANSLFRVQYRGTTPLFKKYRVPAKVGPINFWTMKETPDGRVIFLGSDGNFYMVAGDATEPCGDNIKPFILAGVKARLQYAVSGILYDRSQYWTSFSYFSGTSANDRTVVMDWSRPYQDKFGRRQFPWFIYSIPASCFAEIDLSGQKLLYHGGYVGKMYKDDTGTNDNGAAFVSSYVSKSWAFGDITLEKKFSNIVMSYADKGDWDLDMSFVCDSNVNTEKVTTQNMSGGQGGSTPRFDDGVSDFDDSGVNFATASDADVSREINRQGKTLQTIFGTDGLDESFLIYYYTLHAKPLRRGTRTREG